MKRVAELGEQSRSDLTILLIGYLILREAHT